MKALQVALGVSVQALAFGALARWLEGPARFAQDGALATFLLLAGAFCGGEIALAPSALPAKPRRRRGGWAGPAAATGLLLLLLQAIALTEHAHDPELRSAFPLLLGSGLLLTGLALRLLALRTLGSAFQTEHCVHEDQHLIESGVFAWVRHPSELGLLLAALGMAVLLQSPVAGLVWAIGLIPASLLRIHREEALLAQAFPGAYARYARRVPALLPTRGPGGKSPLAP